MRAAIVRGAGLAAVWAAAACGVRAELFVDASSRAEARQGQIGAALGYASSEFDYSVMDNLERIPTVLQGAFALTDRFALLGAAAYLRSTTEVHSERKGPGYHMVDNVDGGNGYALALGARGTVWRKDAVDVVVYTQLAYLDEDFGTYSKTRYNLPSTTDLTSQFTEWSVGAMLTDRLGAYSYYYGVECIPYSGGEYSFDSMNNGEPGFSTMDSGRSGWFTLRAGARYDFPRFWIRGDAAILAEYSLSIGVGASF